MYSVLPDALRSFHATHPRVELELHEMVTEEQADALQEGRIHVGIGRQPDSIAGCTRRPVLRERIMVVLPVGHPSAAAEHVRITDLADDPLLLYPQHPAARFAGFVESLYRDRGLVPEVAHRTSEIQTAIGLVAAGLGVTYVGESVAHHGRDDVVYRHLDDLDDRHTTTLEAVFREHDESTHLHAFLACLPGFDGSHGVEKREA
jgi:DNA-binding transcriptional LysR family regulator